MKKKELAVAALRAGTVIDHIPSEALFQAVRLLGLENCGKPLTIGCNLPSRAIGSKGIIKVEDTYFAPEVLNRIAVIAPGAVVNTIRDYEVVGKQRVELPDDVVGTVRCPNPKCITNHEPMPTRFSVVATSPAVLRCRYCEHDVAAPQISFNL